MGYRYCPECGEWLETAEYTVDEMGETICPDHEIATHGFLTGRIDSERDIIEQLPTYYDDRNEMIDAAKEKFYVGAGWS